MDDSAAGLPSYFAPMLLCDRDRLKRYGEAIATAIADFRTKNGRAPDVLDLGCGTGVLGLKAWRAGARSVTSADLNPECIRRTKETIAASGAPANWVALRSEALPAEMRFDMIVFEMLGTLSFGEDGLACLEEHRSRLRTQGILGGPYVVPRTVSQTVGAYHRERGEEDDWLWPCLLDRLEQHDTWIGTNSINLHPACLGLEPEAPPQLVYAANYVAGTEECFTASFPASSSGPSSPPSAPRLLVAEWTAELWAGVRLENTLRAYREDLAFGNALGRECAWGFAIAAPPAGEDVQVTVATTGIPILVAHAGAWSVRDIDAAPHGASLGACLDPEWAKEVQAAVARVPDGTEVLVETGENVCVVPRLERLLQRRRLPELWHQRDVSEYWTMRNPIVRSSRRSSSSEKSDGSNDALAVADGPVLALALLPDVEGQAVDETVCRYNDDAFADEAHPTADLVMDLVQSLGGTREFTRTLPHTLPPPLPWGDVVLEVADAAEATALGAPLRCMHGYASTTRHGMRGDDYMPGNFMQGLPHLVVPEKRGTGAAAILLRMASPHALAPETRPMAAIPSAECRRLVSRACVSGAAVVVEPGCEGETAVLP